MNIKANNSDILTRSHSRFGLIEKLFVWSIVLEPMIFFTIFEANLTGIGGNISRSLQFLVIVSILVRTMLTDIKDIYLPNIFHLRYRWFVIFIVFYILSMLYGYSLGAYESSTVTISRVNQGGISAFSSILNGQLVRPLLEVFILIFYFMYMVILPQFLLRNNQGINYFFKIFFFMFFLSFFLGILDLILAFFFNFELIPRTIADWRHVGNRFHGLAGEPRDAFVFLALGACMLYLRDLWRDTNTNRLWYFTIFVAALLTQSLSGYIGLAIMAGLILVYGIPKMSLKINLTLLICFILIGTSVYFYAINSARILQYIEYAPIALEVLKNNEDLPAMVQTQIVNIYPIWIRFTEILNLDLLPTFIGTGAGSSAVLNGNFVTTDTGLKNPNANVIRLFYEAGIIGSLIYIYSFLAPLKTFISNESKKRGLTLITLIILGACFGHRSTSVFIVLGTILLIFSLKNKPEEGY